MLMNEIWKDVFGYEGYYIVSNFGNVIALERKILKSNGKEYTRKRKIKAQTLNGDGYLTVNLSKAGKNERISTHILVARAFVDGYKNGYEVDHIDCNRTNNRADNLRWVTHKENVKHCLDVGNHVSQVKDWSRENNPNYGNHKLHEYYLEHPELAVINLARLGAQNGRAVPITVVFSNGETKTFGYLLEAARYLIANGYVTSKNDVTVANKISKSLKNGEKMLGMSFYKK